ncbi:hypothetical protein ACQ4M3_39750 [Leptolyngbya sp. AN03gr2]|uniref:hypothetical protein n=1 Tax=unclassified Leptolyngbya TaxID=2650499 RepID=UPI003D317FC3
MGSYTAVCWLTRAPIHEGDRACAIILERRLSDYYFTPRADSLFVPRSIFAQGKYNSYGWLSLDANQPEFQTFLEKLPQDPTQPASYGIRKALKQASLNRNENNSKDQPLTIALVTEAALNEVRYQFPTDDLAPFVTALETAKTERDTLTRAADDWLEASERVRQHRDALITQLFPASDFPTLIFQDLLELLHLSFDQQEAILLQPRWLEVLATVGAFYSYHQQYLWHPVCEPMHAVEPERFNFNAYIALTQERCWIAAQTQRAALQEQTERGDGDTVIRCQIQTADGLVSLKVNAFDFLQVLSETPEGETNDAYFEQILQNPNHPDLVRQLFESDLSAQSQDWLWSQEYVRRSRTPIFGRFDLDDLKSYVYFFHPELAERIGITYDNLVRTE